MKPFDRPLDADVQDEIDRLEAALRGDADADATLSALVEDVRAARPALDAAARERLERRARVAAGGAGSRPVGTRAPGGLGRRRWRLALALGAVAVVAVPVAGVVLREEAGVVVTESLSGDAGSSDGSLASGVPAVRPEARSSDLAARADSGPVTESLESLPRTEQSTAGEGPASGLAEPAPSAGRTSSSGSSGSSSSGAAASGTSLAKDRSVVREARQVVRVPSSGVAAAASKVSEIVAGQGGYVDTSSVSEAGSAPRAVFGIVVPSARLDATIAAIGRIGKPVALERTTSDVTAQRASIDDRLRDLRADRSSVRLQLARATDADQRAAKRRELRLLSSRIARLEGEQRELRDEVATARLSLELTTARSDAAIPADDDGRWGLADAWDDAGDVLQVVGGVVLIAAVILLPLTALVGLLVLGRRRLTANRKNRTIGDA